MDEQMPKALLKKYRLGQCSEEEKSLVEQWYNQQARQAETFHSKGDIPKLKAQSLERIRNAHPFVSNQKRGTVSALIIAFSTAVAAMICVGFFWLNSHDDSDKSGTASFVQIKAGNGELKKILLPDSSIAILNAGTTLTYAKDYNSTNRKVTIQEGEVFFDVKHNLTNHSSYKPVEQRPRF